MMLLMMTMMMKMMMMLIDYDDDLNCTIVAIKNNGGDPMTLRQVSDRIGVSFVRVKQIEDDIKKKLVKTKFDDK